jgi:hypothetical protein
MSSSAWRKALLALSVLTVMASFTSRPVFAAAGEGTQPAVWAPKEITFVYYGFTTKYSCDGLRSKMRDVLLQLGAQEDLQVSSTGCTNVRGGPDTFPGVRVRMNVLQPAAGTATADAVPAQWQAVELKTDYGTTSRVGDCELVEQIKRDILPLFTTRNVELNSNCVPHQASTGITSLKAEVLRPVPEKAAASS